MRKSVGIFFPRRKDRKDRSTIIAENSSDSFQVHPSVAVPNKSSRSRNSISILTPDQQQQSRRRSSQSSAFFAFVSRRKSIGTPVQTTSEASTAPSNSCVDGPLDRLNEEMEKMTAKSPDDALLDDAVESLASSVQLADIQEPSTNSNTPDGITTPEYLEENEDPFVISSYGDVPVLEQTKLPRGGVSIETSAVGRVQFGIPPETIKDSMKLGLPVPQVYIVPVERFCREIGPALGVNLAEFEFPAYFNFFVYKKRCTLVVDSVDAEDNIRRVFSETLLGPEQFRRDNNPICCEPEDFAADFPKDAMPDFQKELKHFRIMPDGKELVIETILNFLHFEMRSDGHDNLGIPPPRDGEESLVESSEKEAAKQVDLIYGDALGMDEFAVEECVPADEIGVERRETKKPWTYSQARFMGDVSTVWPSTATAEQIKSRSVPRVEIFKMPGGTEYIIHDVNENNIIIGKARISGHVKVSESMSVDGFGGRSMFDEIMDTKEERGLTHDSESSRCVEDFVNDVPPPTFHPPSFGVTVLGNSHGFDKSGSVSGYVLWINGRGVMIDPPPYASATLEREGIRPRTIVGIILTHCHADHDAGAFQKVLTGSPVVVITTPTIYKSFIRKYAALSALSPALLRHSHRFKPAIIGEPLRFQGATFQFTYTLHTIPCVGFRVEWRGRSMVFTGDHFNSPPDMEKLEQSGVLSKARADDLRNLPLQDCDLLLHEAGAPPIHTPLDVLLKLPEKVKKRLFVVHTSALPPDCELKAAPTGTQGTIRLDKLGMGLDDSNQSLINVHQPTNFRSDAEYDNNWSFRNEYESPRIDRGNNPHSSMYTSLSSSDQFMGGPMKGRTSMFNHRTSHDAPPLVALRPASSTDAWFILNLLSAVPFLSSLSYTSTMELLETARVNAYRKREVIVPANRRNHILCVVWEGTCSEVLSSATNTVKKALPTVSETNASKNRLAVWHAGDWTGPLSLQPDVLLSGESSTSATHDIVAVSSEGVKVITVEFSSLHSILKSGSSLYSKYLERNNMMRTKLDMSFNDQQSTNVDNGSADVVDDTSVHEMLSRNSALRKLNAVQKRHLESLAEGPIRFQPGDRLWRAGGPVDRAFIIVSGSASFVPKRRNAGSATVSVEEDSKSIFESSIGHNMQIDAKKVAKELGRLPLASPDVVESALVLEPEQVKLPSMSLEKIFNKSGLSSDSQNPVERLRQGLERRANHANTQNDGTGHSVDLSFGESQDHDSMDTDNDSHMEYTDDIDGGGRMTRNSVFRRRSSRARKANKVLGRLYNRRAFTGGLVFSRGHFLGDVSKMVDGLLASDLESDMQDDGPTYGFGVQMDGADDAVLAELTIHEEGGDLITHSSTLTAGSDGCVVLVFPKASLIPFLDQYPGVLLSLLGTQVVV